MKTAVKQKDIAAALGLSISTVARALAGSPRIGRETTERVRLEAEKRGYVVDQSARAIRQGTSSLVGLIAPDLQNDFYATVARALSERCRERGLQLVVAVSNDDGATELHHVRNLYASRARGIVVIPSIEMATESRRLLSTLPHVQLVRHCNKLSSDWFGVADEEAMRLGVAHLAALGHRRIAYIGSSLSMSTGVLRLQGFRRALREQGLDPTTAAAEVGGCSVESGHAAMANLLSLRSRPTGVVLAGARITDGAYACARERGVLIPDELSFVGFSDAPAYRWWGSGLTTIALPVEEIATAALECLLRRGEPGGATPERPVQVMHRPTLVQRGSTAAPASGRARRPLRQERAVQAG